MRPPLFLSFEIVVCLFVCTAAFSDGNENANAKRIAKFLIFQKRGANCVCALCIVVARVRQVERKIVGVAEEE